MTVDNRTRGGAILFFVFATLVLTALTLIAGSALVPFLVGLLLAYFSDPVAKWIEDKGVSPTWSALFITVAHIVILGSLIALLGPLLAEQSKTMSEEIPKLLAQTIDFINKTLRETGWAGARLNSALIDRTGSFWNDFSFHFFEYLTSIINILMLTVITPFVMFYILKDRSKIIKSVNNLLPEPYAPTIRKISKDMTAQFRGFIRGQALVCLSQAVFHAIGLALIGLNFAILIGVLTGALAFIPILGNLVMLAVALAVAVSQFDGFVQPLLVVAVYGAAQVFEGAIVSPQFVGREVAIHPLWIIFGIVVGGQLFGPLGALLALPVLAVAKVLAVHTLSLYKELDFEKASAGPGRPQPSLRNP